MVFEADCPWDFDADWLTPSLTLLPMLIPLVEPTEWLTPALSDIPCVKEFVREFVTLLLRL